MAQVGLQRSMLKNQDVKMLCFLLLMYLFALRRKIAQKIIIEPFMPPHDKTNKMAYAPSKDSDQPGHLGSLATH